MENKFEQLWNALEHSERKVPSDSFLNELENQAIGEIYSPKVVSLKSFMGIAASFLILIFANVYIVNSSSSSIQTDMNTSLQDEYSLIPNPLI
ncbi:hypothetical protein N9B82_06460 [Saprospiraceae bacterium]|nr:hypothetical protein [Saprospiraceae bacterium]